ncbi:hypothetical protein [Mesorhizobium sp. LSJC255A00]|uniref:hypothetical protein n=1 Tax=Mesorhizobium sp. LSJC255A00 TaxID=1287313 RepID=UPI0012EC525E|nr:hypothetical protein [Mesorhizobium sp. LSJC255A00]
MREIVILSRKGMYNNVGNDKVVFTYFLQDYGNLRGFIDVVENYGAIYDVAIGKISRYMGKVTGLPLPATVITMSLPVIQNSMSMITQTPPGRPS